ncbi:MAG: MFS transporter [Acidobacteriota bacterium]|nr:MFS transporter [Acidobacteriota bacterium]
MAPSPGAPPHLRRNFIALLAHGMLGQTGFRLLGAPTFLPAYLSILAGNNAAVGIARAIQSLGMALSPFLGAWMVEHRVYVKRLGLVFGGFMRLQILFIALTALLLPPSAALIAVWIVIGIWGFASGLQGVTFTFLISKAIPPRQRGRLQGFRNVTSGATLLVVSALGGLIVDSYGFPDGYGWTFMLAFLLTSLSLLAFSTIREPGTAQPKVRVDLASRLRDLPALLGQDPSFRHFFSARLLGTASRGAMPFYVLYIGQSYGLSGARLATLTIIFTISQALGSLVWGTLADAKGFKAVLFGCFVVWIGGNAMILSTTSLWGAYAVFALVGVGLSGFMLAGNNLALEFGAENDRPMRIAATNSAAELVGGLSVLGAGFLADSAVLTRVFWLSIAFQLLAMQQTSRIDDPRCEEEAASSL